MDGEVARSPESIYPDESNLLALRPRFDRNWLDSPSGDTAVSHDSGTHRTDYLSKRPVLGTGLHLHARNSTLP